LIRAKSKLGLGEPPASPLAGSVEPWGEAVRHSRPSEAALHQPPGNPENVAKLSKSARGERQLLIGAAGSA
jgi:hypothetical protein